jgi:ABC-type dipeptide/oligopeptide/nickel transport system permease subunit
MSRQFKSTMKWKPLDTAGVIGQGVAMETKIAALNTFYFLVPLIVVIVSIVVWLVYHGYMEGSMGVFIVAFAVVLALAIAYMYRSAVSSVAQQRWTEIATRIQTPISDIQNNVTLLPSALTDLFSDVVISGNKTYLKSTVLNAAEPTCDD